MRKPADNKTTGKTIKKETTTKDVKASTSRGVTSTTSSKTMKEATPSTKDVTASVKKGTTTLESKHQRNISEQASKLKPEDSKANLKKSNHTTGNASIPSSSNSPTKTINLDSNSVSTVEKESSVIKTEENVLAGTPTNVSANLTTPREKTTSSNVINLNSASSSSINLNVSTPKVVQNDSITDELKSQLQHKEAELAQLKKIMQEKKELQDQLGSVRKERDEWHKKYDDHDVTINSCLKELEDSSNQIQKLMKENEETKGKLLLQNDQVKKLSKENEEMKTKISDMELDLEIKNEEYEALKIELENVQLEKENDNATTNLQELANLDADSATVKIVELETQVNKLTSTLVKVTENRNTEAIYFKQEIEKLTQKLQTATKELEEIPKKEEKIKQLTQKITDNQNLIGELKEQLAVFSSASSMLDNLITEKTQLEIDLNREKEEKEILKGEMETTDMLIQELENAAKIANDIVREKENEVLEIQNKLNTYKLKLEENDSKEKQLVNIITELKNENKIIREEISKSKNVNVDEILHKNLNQNSKLKTLERQKVLHTLAVIDLSKLNLRNKIIHTMIPKKTFENAHIDSFDKFLLVQSLRKKTLQLIFNVIENDLLEADKENESEKTAQDSIEEENNKTMNNFLRNVTQTLIDFNTLLYTLEVVLCSLNAEELKSLNENTKNNIWLNLSASAQFIDNLISMIKGDTFGVKFQYEGLRSIVKTLTEETKSYIGLLSKEELDPRQKYPIIPYISELLNYTFNMLLTYKQEKVAFVGKNINFKEIVKSLHIAYKQTKKTVDKIDEKFFNEILYEESHKIFDLENSYYTKLIDHSKTINGENIEEGHFSSKYETLVDSVSKFCVVILSYLEKYEKEISNTTERRGSKLNTESTTEGHNEGSTSSSKHTLPVKAWNDLIAEVYNELESGVKIKEDLDDANIKLKESKLEKLKLESKIEEMTQNKQINDRKLGEALIQAGKVGQLENEIEEKNKKIEKYNTTIEALVKNIESEQEKNKELKSKLDNAVASGVHQMMRGGNEGRQSKRGALVAPSFIQSGGSTNNPLGLKNTSTNNLITDSVPLLNTICELQRERKLLKSKLMKDKLQELFNDNSYINRYISKNKKENLEFYEQVEDNMQNLNNNYKKTRKDLCLPKVYDLTDEDYNYDMTKKKEENKVSRMRMDYMQDVDKILTSMFGDHTLDKAFKDMIDNDINRTLDFFGEKKMLVGRIKFSNKENIDKNVNDIPVSMNIPPKVVPIFMSEKSLKILNKTLMH